jgi:hypothetical protein
VKNLKERYHFRDLDRWDIRIIHTFQRQLNNGAHSSEIKQLLNVNVTMVKITIGVVFLLNSPSRNSAENFYAVWFSQSLFMGIHNSKVTFQYRSANHTLFFDQECSLGKITVYTSDNRRLTQRTGWV